MAVHQNQHRSAAGAFRMLTLIALAMITLVLGIQIGMRYEKQILEDRIEELEFLYGERTGSGYVVSDPEEEVNPALMWAVWRMLLKHYIEPADLEVQNMLYGAVSGMVQAVDDPYTVFMTPKELKDFRDSLNGELEGIGAELTLRDGVIIVVAPLKGSPAMNAGLLPEDIIVAVDDESTEGETLHQTVHRIRGPKGTQVKITVMRKGELEPIDLLITRAHINVPSVEMELKKTGSGSVGYIAINQFADDTTREVRAAMQSLKEEELTGIILDVRYNGGGYLDRAVDLVSMFIPQGKVVSVARKQGEPDHHYVYGAPIATEIPLVVLINEGSASSSEILAGALQDHKRATIIGKKSFGKGTVQEIFELPGGSSIRITIAKWLMPSGRDLSEEGIYPDIEVDRSVKNIVDEIDPQLEAALEYLLDGQDISEKLNKKYSADAETVLEETEE